MIGGGILAGVGLAGVKLFEQQKHSQKMVSYEASLNSYHQNLIKTFTHTQMCNATIKQALIGGKIPAGSLNNFYTCQDESTCSDFKLDSTDTLAAYFPTDPAKRWVSNNTWRVSSLGVLGPVTSSGDMRLQVTYESNPNFLKVLKSVKKEITVAVRFQTGSAAGSTFKECVNNQKASINNLQSDMCRSLNSNRTKNGITGNFIATWDDAEQKCVMMKHADITCPIGQVFQGFDNDGSLNCKTEPTTFLPTTDKSRDSKNSLIDCSRPVFYADKQGQISMDCQLSNGGPLENAY
jgi:hypothetical protein